MQYTMWVFGLIPLVISRCLIAVIELDFFKDQFLVLGDLQTEQLEIKIEITDWVASWLIILKVKSLHVRMRKCLVNCDTTIRVKCQHLLDEVNSLFVCSPE